MNKDNKILSKKIEYIIIETDDGVKIAEITHEDVTSAAGYRIRLKPR